MSKPIIPVFFTISDDYSPYLGVALKSAILNSSKENNYKAIIIYESLSDENRKKLGDLATENSTVEFVPMKSGLEAITDKMGNRLRSDYFTLTIYYRIFIAEMFPEYDKGIYIDSDVVLEGDIANLYNVDLGDNYIGACRDFSIMNVPELVEYIECALGLDRTHYINSGVLLMNLKKLRELNVSEHFLSLYTKYQFDCLAPDQDYLNIMCNGRILYLPEQWNTMPNEDRPVLDDVNLIHYNLFWKPWCYDHITYYENFWKYAELSPYYEELKNIRDTYSDEQRASDKECLGLLISRGHEIPNQDVTVKKITETGVKIKL